MDKRIIFLKIWSREIEVAIERQTGGSDCNSSR